MSDPQHSARSLTAPRVCVLGAGAWGTAVAIAAARGGSQVTLWARDPEQAQAMQSQRCNARYLPDHLWPDSLRAVSDLSQALQGMEEGLILVATPMAGLRATLRQLRERLPQGPAALAWLCKGFEAQTGALGHEIAAQELPRWRCGVLSGPSFAQEVAAAQPTALVAASQSPEVAMWCTQVLHSDSLRVYSSDDPIGVEVGGAVKNVLAIATGIADGLELGLNARAALITRGLAEMSRLGVAMGARVGTFMGLSGLGDLVLTATGNLSRNRTVGLHLARGEDLPAILAQLGHVAEGVICAPVVAQRAHQLAVDMPLTEAVVAVLEGRQSGEQAVNSLMGRLAKSES